MLNILYQKYTKKDNKAYEKADNVAQEALSSIKTILSLGLHKKAVDDYKKSLQYPERRIKHKAFLNGLFGGIRSGLVNCYFAVGIYYGTYLTHVECENYNAGNIILTFFAMVTATICVGHSLPFLKELDEAKKAARKIFDLIDEKTVLNERRGKIIGDFKGQIEFEDIEFSYPQKPDAQILNRFSLSIPAGKTVALVGARLVGYIYLNFNTFIFIN